jgi:hypothetical protein
MKSVIGGFLVCALWVGAGLFLVVNNAHSGAGQTDLRTRLEVDVIYKNKKGELTARKATVHAFSDARFVVCLEYKDVVVADCLVIEENGEALWIPVRLLEEKV